jgi:hypothetical protein
MPFCPAQDLRPLRLPWSHNTRPVSRRKTKTTGVAGAKYQTFQQPRRTVAPQKQAAFIKSKPTMKKARAKPARAYPETSGVKFL